ncbi:MAG: DEAD/DEAH box helicase [Candidatus Micrarchaeaceae archaeon]
MTDLYSFLLETYPSFTEIQKLSIPVIENGENCIIVAPTGSGKTEAAVLPVLNLVSGKGAHPISIIYITPLRALNRDMLRRLEALCDKAGISIGVRHGDTTQSERNKQARVAPMLLITTPETLQSILPTKSMGGHLKNVKAVIVDELHEFYYSKRGAQLSLALERLEELAPGFQRIGISATVGNPEVVKRFLCNYRSCKVVMSNLVKDMRLSVDAPTSPKYSLDALEEKFELDRPSLARLESIAELASSSKSSIIFANTRQVVESLGSRLLYLNSIRPFGGIGVHHGSLDKMDRISLEDKFKKGGIKSIIATSSLELGIDIGSIDLVVQYGSPRQALRLAQRVGRSGHTNKGVARGVVISTTPLETLETLAIFRSVKSASFETFNLHSGALDVLANQVCGMALDRASTGIKDLHRIIGRSFVYKDVDEASLTRLVEFMSRLRLVGFDGKSITAGGRTRMYYYGHLSVIPDSKRFVVKNVIENRIISSLDERFVANNVDEGGIFITKGLPWKVLSIDKDVISVEPSTDLKAAVPDWSGEDIPVSEQTVSGVFRILGNVSSIDKEHATANAFKSVKELAERQAKRFLPSGNTLFVERLDDYCMIYSGLGTQANEALGRVLAYLVSTKLGHGVNVKSSPYMVMLEIKRNFDIVGALNDLSAGNLDDMLVEAVTQAELFRYRFITVSKLFGVIDRGATVSRSMAKRIIKVMHGTPIYDETLRELLENYFDIGVLRRFLGALRGKSLHVNVIDSVSASLLTNMILNSAYYTKELISPLAPNKELVESFSKFILSKSVKLLCTYCGFFFTRKLSALKDLDRVTCQSCMSPMVTFYDGDYRKVVEKRNSSKKLDRKERALMEDMLRYSSLIESYGPKAVIALSVYGIGPKSAARALMMLRHEEKDFFMDLIELQKNFIRTKKYWSA